MRYGSYSIEFFSLVGHARIELAPGGFRVRRPSNEHMALGKINKMNTSYPENVREAIEKD